jgi:hypothetical protein
MLFCVLALGANLSPVVACPPVAVPTAAAFTMTVPATVAMPTMIAAPLTCTVAVPQVVNVPVAVAPAVVQQQVVRTRVVQPRQVFRSRSMTRVGGLGLF